MNRNNQSVQQRQGGDLQSAGLLVEENQCGKSCNPFGGLAFNGRQDSPGSGESA